MEGGGAAHIPFLPKKGVLGAFLLKKGDARFIFPQEVGSRLLSSPWLHLVFMIPTIAIPRVHRVPSRLILRGLLRNPSLLWDV